jgi:hypothetical protein
MFKDSPEQPYAIKGNGGNIQIRDTSTFSTNGAQGSCHLGARQCREVIAKRPIVFPLDGEEVLSLDWRRIVSTPEQRMIAKAMGAAYIQINSTSNFSYQWCYIRASTLGKAMQGRNYQCDQ